METIDPRMLVKDASLHTFLCNSVGLERVATGVEYVAVGQRKLASTVSMEDREDLNFSDEFQDFLVETYFQHFHPLCPAVCETAFVEWYHGRDDRPATRMQEMLLHAIFFGAFSHVAHHQLGGSHLCSVIEGQTTLFRVTRSLFHANAEVNTTDIALAQTALILSFWSPLDQTSEVNVYWADLAMQHAVRMGCDGPNSTRRRRLILWCCLSRDRTIKLGLRKRRSLSTVAPGRIPTLADFADECDRRSKCTLDGSQTCRAGAFILMCKLSVVMAAIIQSRTKVRWVSWWQDCEGTGHQQGQLEDVAALEEHLDIWRREFDTFRTAHSPHCDDRSYLHILLITSLGVRSALWERTLVAGCYGSVTRRPVRDLAHYKIKELSFETLSSAQIMFKSVGLSVIPSTILAWIIVPIVTYLLQVASRSYTDVEESRKLSVMMNALENLRLRSQGAESVSQLIRHIRAQFCAPEARASLAQHPSVGFGCRPESPSGGTERLTAMIWVVQHALSLEVRSVTLSEEPCSQKGQAEDSI